MEVAKDLIRHCVLIAKVMGVTYQLKDKEISFDEVFSIDGLLPAIAKRADQLCSLCFGHGLGVNFVEKEKTILGFTVEFDDVQLLLLRLLCISDILSEISNGSVGTKVSLDELLYD